MAGARHRQLAGVVDPGAEHRREIVVRLDLNERGEPGQDRRGIPSTAA